MKNVELYGRIRYAVQIGQAVDLRKQLVKGFRRDPPEQLELPLDGGQGQ